VTDLKDPATYSLITYLWVGGLSAWGGLVSFFRKRKEGHVRPWNIAELVGELATSAFAGVITFWLCEAAEINPLITASLIAISGHMGTRALFQLEKWAEGRFPMPSIKDR